MKKFINLLIGLLLFLTEAIVDLFVPSRERKAGLSYFVEKNVTPIVHSCKAWMYDLFARWHISHLSYN